MKYWYKNTIMYSLDVETFLDANGDGMGDITGLIDSLDYLENLGVTCIWLLPFYPTPNRDNGYDVTDYFDIDRRLGDLGDFTEFLEQAEERNIRVLIDLVINHTSVHHPWFQEARKGPGSRFHDFYIWSDNPDQNEEDVLPFRGQQSSHWTLDEETGKYYYHTFYSFQPDLNMTNPGVREEIKKIMRFWLHLGVSGFRIDAAAHLIRRKGGINLAENPFEIMQEFRQFVEERNQEAVLLAEVDLPPDRLEKFFGGSGGMHMLFNFYLDNYLFLSMARGSAEPVRQALRTLPETTQEDQWATFIRNHDQLDLDQLSEKERQEVLETFAPEQDARIFGSGIRRRLAPILGGDTRRMKLMYSLMFSLPGTPVIRYGQEIGMGDDLSLPGRSSVRTAMQWSDGKNGGFSTADPENLARPVIRGGPYGYEKVNVSGQRLAPDSFLNWFSRAIGARKQCPEIGFGSCEPLASDTPAVLIHRAVWRNNQVITVHNFSDREQTIHLKKEDVHSERLEDLFCDSEYEPLRKTGGKIRIGPYGFRWFRTGTLRM